MYVCMVTSLASALETEIEILKQKYEQDSVAWKVDLTELQALAEEKAKAEASAHETNKDILHQVRSEKRRFHEIHTQGLYNN